MTKLSNKGKDLFTVYIVYLISTYVAFQSGMYYSNHVGTPILKEKFNIPTTMTMEIGLFADLMATVVIYIFSIIYNNSSMYDAYCKFLIHTYYVFLTKNNI